MKSEIIVNKIKRKTLVLRKWYYLQSTHSDSLTYDSKVILISLLICPICANKCKEKFLVLCASTKEKQS